MICKHWMLTLCGLSLLTFQLCAADKKDPKEEAKAKLEAQEAEEAAKEDESERDNFNLNVQTTFSGVLTLIQHKEGEPLPSVIGSFAESKGNEYPAKLADAGLYELLQKFAGKNITVFGKLRNKGKYLVITDVAPGESGPASGAGGANLNGGL